IKATVTPETAELDLVGATLAPRTGVPTHLSGHASGRRNAGLLTADVVLNGDRVDFSALGELWPEGVGGRGAKPWMVENIPSGIGQDLHLEVSLRAREDFSAPAITAIAGGLGAHELTVHWLRPIPPLAHGVAQIN